MMEHSGREGYGQPERTNGGTAVGSFVIRCQTRFDDASGGAWRIRVTYVQGQEEQTVASWEEAVLFMQQRMKRGNMPYDR
ncbi:hypothetical protein M5W83_00550 [Paenibacillus thiaminolyticus]|uniref:Uncharacterized protein n=2 Tax=Paenibacillus thiaminolyticus TaxID=49283 RepID=A0ABT4FSI9_PANTH|nr:hypothetical protein [Paenibacillus thiaminolyticus]MCY9536201.1 hypothetical protein [Paenibacillus thiaminolyticus]MCY9603534.1 hypothetical protein [Paenibacillus thiaminolyticus]MCY9605668.1 hypothetical protein [Paenibacillus thiaminolyticus]MCY9611831.1 hypothetical protein [Paenibacillus thiaminolyticus]MCY9620970.1 hypothetical protein [Paenibacillus thiaminolyticus]